MLNRRQFMSAAAALVAFRDDTLDTVARLVPRADADPELAAQDEDFWGQIQQSFALDRNVANFNNGGCSPSPRIVMDAFRRQMEYSNQAPSYLMWQQLEPEVESVRRGLAKVFGCDSEEIAITRNASESLENILFGIPLSPGDEILTTTNDYPRMITTIDQRCRREGVKMVQGTPPLVPKSRKELVDTFESKITDKTKLMLVSHVSFMNGQIFPVRDVVELGRKRGIPVVVDGAHAFAQFPYERDDLNCDYYGTSLHKWLMAPLGTGFMYVRKNKIADLWSLMASAETQKGDIRKFEEIGTHPAANHNAIGEALTFHELIGVERKAARLRYLRSRWVDKIRGEAKVQFQTNLSPEHSCGLTLVGIDGIKPGELQAWLLAKHSVYTTTIVNDRMAGIRVTPNVYSTLAEVDRFANAMYIAATKGIA